MSRLCYFKEIMIRYVYELSAIMQGLVLSTKVFSTTVNKPAEQQ